MGKRNRKKDRSSPLPAAELPSKTQKLKWAERTFTVLCTIIPAIPSMPVVYRVVFGCLAWFGVLHLSFTDIPCLAKLPTDVKVGRAVIITIYLVILLVTPIKSAWRSERAADTDGDLVPHQGQMVNHRGNAPPIDMGEGSQGIQVPQIQPLYDARIIFQWGEKGPELTTTVRDKAGNEVVQIEKNHWHVTSFCLDKNYTNDTLEVQDLRGHVVLQMKIFLDKIRLQGLWYDDSGHGIEIMKSPDPSRPGSVVYLMNRNGQREPPQEYLISPWFLYPSKEHWGELVH